ncbi:MAG: hypothetical protein ACJ72Z_05035 [Pyrinomonadaceae bacterium]
MKDENRRLRERLAIAEADSLSTIPEIDVNAVPPPPSMPMKPIRIR